MIKNSKAGLLERSAARLELPGEALANLPKLQIVGQSRLTVENHRGLLEYGESEIEINGGKTIIRVRGEGLGIRGMNASVILVEGRIISVEMNS